jgi:hypothetical protein
MESEFLIAFFIIFVLPGIFLYFEIWGSPFKKEYKYPEYLNSKAWLDLKRRILAEYPKCKLC